MQTRSHQPWGVRLGTLAIWALAAASAAYWGLRLTARPPGMPAPTAAPAPVAADMQAMARLLGAVTAQTPQAAAAPVSSRFALVGVLAGQQGGSGAALIAVDGKPAKPYRVGATVDAGLVLQSLGPRQARLGAGQEGVTTVTLEMPVRK
ncbi:MAG TPA: type II secretion system protein N [Giesbergeria sp.]|jgi:general secretion pathway protein C|nr:general secretion pathway protein C [Comamonas sp.]MCL4770739.1 general secretion pathway protein C [Burkholderiaceae bacterium]HNQ09566.1 type II secretion system protein N [Giesbergeria sp.]